MKNKKGFTLIELLAVIVILAILATAAFTLVLPQLEKARRRSFVSEISSLVDSAELYFLDHPSANSVTINGMKTYMKNYDASKRGCIQRATSSTGYKIKYTNGKYSTKGSSSFYEMASLKGAEGNASDANVVAGTSDIADAC